MDGLDQFARKLGVAKPMTAKDILKKIEHGLSVFNRFYGSTESAA